MWLSRQQDNWSNYLHKFPCRYAAHKSACHWATWGMHIAAVFSGNQKCVSSMRSSCSHKGFYCCFFFSSPLHQAQYYFQVCQFLPWVLLWDSWQIQQPQIWFSPYIQINIPVPTGKILSLVSTVPAWAGLLLLPHRHWCYQLNMLQENTEKNEPESPTLLIRIADAQKKSKLAASNGDHFSKTSGSHLRQLHWRMFLLAHVRWGWFSWRHATSGSDQSQAAPHATLCSLLCQHPRPIAWGSFCSGFGAHW